MNYHGFAPLTSFPTGRPLSVRFPSYMRLLAGTLRCLPQVLQTPYDADADLAFGADEQTIIVTDNIDVVLSEPLARTNVRFILIGSEKQHLERLLPDRVLVLAASQLEAIRYLARQLEVGDWGLLVNRLYDSTFKQRCRQLAPAYGATLIQEFSNQSEIEKIIQKNSLQRVIAVSPYESIPPLAGRVKEVLYTGVSQLTEELFLEQIFLKKVIEVPPHMPVSAAQNQSEVFGGSQKNLSSSQGQQKETSLSSSGAFPKPIFLPMMNVEPEVAVCWMPPPVTSISQAPLPPKFKVIDLDPLSCMKLQMYCSSNGHNFARADSYRDLYRCLVDSEPIERILIIASKENFQLVRDLNETVQKAKIVMLYNRQSYLSEAETAFKQEMKVAVLIADKNHLADILANTPGMIFPDLIPSSSVPTSQLAESKGFRRVDTGPIMQAVGSNSVSLVETFDMDNPRKRPIIESELAIASDKEGSDDGLVVNAFPIIRDILQQRNPFGSDVKVSSVNSSNFPEGMAQHPNIAYGDVIKESSQMRSDGGSSLRKELVVEAPKPEFNVPQETTPEERAPVIGSEGQQEAIKCTIFQTPVNLFDQLPTAEFKPTDTNIKAGERQSQIPEVIKCSFPEVSPKEQKSEVGSNPHAQYLMNGEEAHILPAEIFQGQPLGQPMESLSHSKSDLVELPGLDGFQKKTAAYEALVFDPPKEVEPVRQLEMEPLIGQSQQGAELPPLLTPSGSQLGPVSIPLEGLAEPVFVEPPLKLDGPVELLPQVSPQHLESGVAEGHTAPEIQPVADRSYADSEAVPRTDQRLMVLAEQLPRDEYAAVLLPASQPQPRISDLIQTHDFSIPVPEPYTAVPYSPIPQPVAAPTEQKVNIEEATQHTIEPSNRLESEPSIELAVSPLAQPPVALPEQNMDRLMSARSSQAPSQLAVHPQGPIELDNKQLCDVAPIENVPALPASQLMEAAATEIKSVGKVDYSRKESKQSGREGLMSSQHKQASVKGSQPKEVSAKGSQYKEASVRSGQQKQASVKDSRPLQLLVQGSQYKQASAKGAYLKKPSRDPSEKGPKQEPSEPILVKQPSQRSLKKDPSERSIKKQPSERSIKKEPIYLGESVDTLPKSSTSLQNLVAQEYMSNPPIQSEPLISGESYWPPENAEPTTPKMYGKTLQQIGSLRKLPSQNAQQATPPIYSQTMAKPSPSAPVIPLSSTPMQNSVPSSIFNDSTPTRIYSFNRSIQPTLILLHKDLTSQPFIEKVDHMVFESLGELLFIMNKESKVPGAKIEVKTIHAPEYHSIPSMPNVRIIRYVVGFSSSLERTRVKTPLFRRKGSLSRDRQDQVNMKKMTSNPAAEYQTITRQDLSTELKKSFVKRMFNKQLVYILVEDRKMSLVARIEGVKHFNTRLRLETYNRNNILQIAMGLVHDHSLVIVASEEDTMEQARSFLMAYNVPLLYCGPNAGQLMPPPESNIYPMTNKRQVIEMIASIPRFFSAASTTKTAVKSVLDHQVIHLYFESAVTEAYKREIIELAEQQRRKIVPHEIQNHHEIQCLTENMKEEMFVCIVKSQAMYESLLEKPAPNLLVYWTQTERDGLGKLFAELRTLISRKHVQKRQNRLTSTGNIQQNEYGYGPDLNKRLINVEFKKLLKSENSSGISNKSGTDQLDQQPQQQPPPQLQPPMEPIPNSNILEKFHPPKYIISRLESIADSYGNINVLIERSNTQLKEMLMGMPGVTSQDYQNIQGMRSIFELYRSTASFPLLVVVTDRDTLRHVYDLKRLYPNTEYAAVLNMVDAESEISENYKRFRKPKLPEYLKDVFFAVESNRRLAILLAARAEIVRKRLVVRSMPSPISLSSNYARLCIFHKQPKDEFIVNSLRDRILRPILNSCMFFGYQSSRDISESLETLDHLGEHMLCIVFERDEQITDVQDHLSKSYRNLHVRFIRVFSKGFKGYASLKDNPNILTEDDNEANILRFVDDFLIGASSSSGSIPPNSRSTAQPIELISSQEIILQSDEVVKFAKAPSAKFEEVAAAAKPEVPSPTKDSLIIDFDHSSMKQPVKEEKPEVVPLDSNPYNLPIPETMRQSSSHQKDETELKSSAKVGAGIQTSHKSSSKKALRISNIPSSKIRRAASVRDLLKKKSIGEEEPPSEDSSQLVPSIHSVMPLKKPTSFLHQVVSMAPRKSRPRSAKSRAHSQC